MEYWLKSAGIIAIFWLFYKIFLQRETFYNANRIYFLAGILMSFLLPFYVIYTYVELPATSLIEVADSSIKKIADTAIVIEEIQPVIDWKRLLIYVYVAGFLFLSIKLLLELISLVRFLKNARKVRKNDYYLLITTEKIAPFSFFNRIVIPEKLLNSVDFDKILAHEKIHVKHWHSIDMLIVRITSIVQWFNPFVWMYKYVMEQNLEFIADDFAQREIRNLKEYQYLLLKTGTGKSLFALTNNYFNTNLKKRIIMLQKVKSNRINQLKYIFILPLLSFFIYSFNTKEVYEIKTQLDINSIDFIVPVLTKNIKRINGYGMRINPFTKNREMHNGIDYSAQTGTQVFAAENGNIIATGENKKEGKYIKIKHEKGYQTNYFHLNNINVTKNSKVKKGQIIGSVGNTGMSKAPHLHFEILKDGKYLNPYNFIHQQTKSKVYTFDKNTTDKEINSIAEKLQKESGIKVKITVYRNPKDEIYTYIFSTKYPGEKKYTNRHVYQTKDGIEETRIRVLSTQVFEISNQTSRVIIDKNSVQTELIADKKEKQDFSKKKMEFITDKIEALYIINGKNYQEKEAKEILNKMDPGSIQSIHVYKGDEVVKKYGKEAKVGVIVIQTIKDKIGSSGQVDYQGTTYFYAIWVNDKEKRITIYDRYGNQVNKDLAEKIYVKLRNAKNIEPDIKLYDGIDRLEGGKISYQNKDYFYTIRSGRLIVFEKSGIIPDNETRKAIRNILIQKKIISEEVK